VNPICSECGRFIAPERRCTCDHFDYMHRLDLPSQKCARDGCKCKRLDVKETP
jgi:hypothetical protein